MSKNNNSGGIVDTDKDFKGYTIEEIRFQRKIVSKEIEFCKIKFFNSLENIQNSNPFMPGNSSSITSRAGNMALKMFKGLNYLDYVLIGFSVFKGTRKIFSFFKGLKK